MIKVRTTIPKSGRQPEALQALDACRSLTGEFTYWRARFAQQHPDLFALLEQGNGENYRQ
jgi:hypothetical protein